MNLQRGLAGEVAVEFRIDRFAASGSAPGYVLGGLDLRCCVRNRGYTGLLVPMSIEPLAQVRIPWVIAKLSNVAWSRSGSYVGDDDRSRSVPTLFRKGLLFVLCVDLMEILGFVGS